MRQAALALSLLCLGAASRQAGKPTYDLILKNAQVVDGAGNPWFRADVAISGGTIAAVGHPLRGPAVRVIDVAGQVVAPGFIDVHTHARRGIFDLPTADNYVRQGVTTVFEGQDGSSPLPIRDFLERAARAQPAVNFGTFIGHGSVRQEVLGRMDRRATPEELARMADMVRQGMAEGAFGLSSGLFYLPGVFAPTEELIALSLVAAESGGIYITHMRNEAAKVLDSVRETIAIGEGAHIPVQITHHKVAGVAQKGKSRETLRLVAEARARGVDITLDAYPYTASSTSLENLLPVWSREGGREHLLARLADAEQRPKIKEAIVENIRLDRGGGDPANVQVAFCEWSTSLPGKNLTQITRERGGAQTLEGAADTVLWIIEQGGCRGIFHAIAAEDVDRIVGDPLTMIASDGEVVLFGKASPHPRSYGTFARVLAVYARERKLLSLEEAVRKMTSYPAARLGIADRGLVSPGMKADLVVFDPGRIADKATYDEPHQYAVGVSHVLVNGQIVFSDGKMTGARPGVVLYGPGFAKTAP